MKLTDTQAQILAVEAEQQDRLVKPPGIPPGPRGALAAKLRSAGLIEQARLDADEHAGIAWRQAEGAAIGYRITEAGLAAIGINARPGADMCPGGPTESTAVGRPSFGTPSQAENSPAQLAGPPESNAAVPAARSRRALLAAAQAVLAAWDDEAGQRAGLPDAVANLRTALAGKSARVPRGPAAPRQPREGTKQQRVVALLRRPEGATVAQIAEATGWQAHTVRGFFAGLRKRQGIEVTVLERVRQMGTDGAKGSYSVYRIADAG
jgi:hypothetical protein